MSFLCLFVYEYIQKELKENRYTIKNNFQIKLTLVTKVLVLIYISRAVIKLMNCISKCDQTRNLNQIKPRYIIVGRVGVVFILYFAFFGGKAHALPKV